MADRPQSRHLLTSPTAAAVAITGLFLAAGLPLILLHADRGRGAWDQDNYHLPAVRLFAAQWPHFYFRDYLSATTPGFHLVLAAVHRWVSSDVTALRLASAAITVGMLWTISIIIARRVGASRAIVILLPLVCSLYVFSSGVWILPDNAGWWGVFGILYLGFRPHVDRWTFLGGGIILLLCVLTRQSHLWSAGVLWAAAWLGMERADGGPQLFPPPPGAWRRLVLMVIATAFSCVAVGWFFSTWRGPVPPTFRSDHSGGNAAIPATVLAVLGFVTFFFSSYLLQSVNLFDSRVRIALITGAIVGLVIGIVPWTDYDPEAGRNSGLYNFVERLPTYGHRSPLMIVLSTAGGVALAAWTIVLPPRRRWIFLIAWIGFIAAQSTNAMAWQRYYEPMILIITALCVSNLPNIDVAPTAKERLLKALGPVVLSGLLAAITVLSLR